MLNLQVITFNWHLKVFDKNLRSSLPVVKVSLLSGSSSNDAVLKPFFKNQ